MSTFVLIINQAVTQKIAKNPGHSLSEKPLYPNSFSVGSHGEGLRICGVALAWGIVLKGLLVAVHQQDLFYFQLDTNSA